MSTDIGRNTSPDDNRNWWMIYRFFSSLTVLGLYARRLAVQDANRLYDHYQ